MGGSHWIFINLLSSVLRSQTIFSFSSSVVVARLLNKGITCNEILSDCCNQQQRNQPVSIFFRHKQQKTIADTWAMLISLPERGLDLMLVLIQCQTIWIQTGAYELEHATLLYCCHGVFLDRFIFRSNLLWRRLPWECHNQSQDTNWRHCVTGPELAFCHKRKGVLKIDQSLEWFLRKKRSR